MHFLQSVLLLVSPCTYDDCRNFGQSQNTWNPYVHLQTFHLWTVPQLVNGIICTVNFPHTKREDKQTANNQHLCKQSSVMTTNTNMNKMTRTQKELDCEHPLCLLKKNHVVVRLGQWMNSLQAGCGMQKCCTNLANMVFANYL